MYFTVNLAFVDYLEQLNEIIKTPINRNWTSFKQPIPVSLESFQLSSKLMHAPVMLRDFIDQYQENRITATKWESPTSKFRSFINSFLVDMLGFIAAILTVSIIFVIIGIIMGQLKLKTLVATMALQRVRAVEALNTNRETQNCNSELLKIFNDSKSGNSGVTTSKEIKECVLLGTTLFQHGEDKIISGRYKILCFTNLNKIARNTHLFKLTGELSLENVTSRKNWIWDVLEIRWDDIHIILNEKELHLPTTLIIPLIHKLKVRKLFGKRDYYTCTTCYNR